MSASPAYAAKGWAFKEVFNAGQGNEPAFGDPRDLTIDRSSGDLLVYDNSNRTLSRWSADGTASNFSALGTNVIDGKRVGATNECPDVAADCDEVPGDLGIAGSILDQVAIDNSGTATDGNIYVTRRVGAGSGPVDIFSGAGAFIGRLTRCGGEALFILSRGLGVDGGGRVYVAGSTGFSFLHRFDPTSNPPNDGDCAATGSYSGQPGSIAVSPGVPLQIFVAGGSVPDIVRFNSALVEDFKIPSPIGERLTIDPVTRHLFATASGNVIEYEASGASLADVETIARIEPPGAVRNVAVKDGAEELYLSRAGTPNIEIWEAGLLPTVVTGPADPVLGARATVTGTVDPEGGEVLECFFEYGPTNTYGREVPCTEYEVDGEWQPLLDPSELGTGTEPVPVRGELTELLANGVTHHYRLVARGEFGLSRGADKTLKTADTYFTAPPSPVSESEATLRGTVSLEGIALTACTFEYGATNELGQSEPCEQDPGTILTDDAVHEVSAEIDELEPSTVYRFRLRATNSLGQITTPIRAFGTRGAPGIEAEIASALGESTATLQAQLNPFGSETTYHFEWGPDTTYPNRVPAEGELEGGTADLPGLVSTELEGLEPRSLYCFRVVATNSFDTTEGPGRCFQTLNEHGLPDNRAFELVSPADKGPSGSLVGGIGAGRGTWGSRDGKSFIWPLQNGKPDSSAGGWSRWRAERDEDAGWQSAQTSAPSLIEPPEIDGLAFAHPSVVLYASEDLDCGLLRTYNPVTADTPALSTELGVYNLYLWRVGAGQIGYRAEGGEIAYRGAVAGEVGYELVSDRVPLNPDFAPPGDTYFTQIEAAEDCSRVYFRSGYEWIKDGSGLYEWQAPQGAQPKVLRDAGVLPNGTAGQGANIGTWNGVSPDGGRLFFSARRNEMQILELAGFVTNNTFRLGNLPAGCTELHPEPKTDPIRYGTATPTQLSARIDTALEAACGGGGNFAVTPGAPGTVRIVFRGQFAVTNVPLLSCTPLTGSGTCGVSVAAEVGPRAIFMRSANGSSVVEISASKTAVPTNGARFEIASPDGSKVFFMANYGIAAQSSDGPTNADCVTFTDNSDPPIEQRACDLYAYDVASGELSDISVNVNPDDVGIGARVQGVVGVDADGSHVYFAALGQLVEDKGRSHAENIAGQGSANLYLAGPGGLAYVANVRRGNRDLFFGALLRNASGWSAEVSVDGSRLMFESASRQSWYESGGGKVVYLYDAGADAVMCVSCRLDGEPTAAATDANLVGRSGSRAMSVDGKRVFFTSPDALMPGAEQGKNNVYMWQGGQIYLLTISERGGRPGAILPELGSYHDVSADGSVAFVSTNRRLVPSDRDALADVYAVRIDGGFPHVGPPPDCQVDEAVPLEHNQIYCQGPVTTPPLVPPIANSPGGNVKPLARGCKPNQVRRGGRCVAKRALARRACAKQKGKAKRRCVTKQIRRLNRAQKRQQRRAAASQGRAGR